MTDFLEEDLGFTFKDLEQSIYKAVEKAFNDLLLKNGLLINNNYLPKEVKWVTIKELSMDLMIVKQTVYNWLKNPEISPLLAPYVKKVGSRTLFEKHGFLNVINQFGFRIGKNRDYKYKEVAKNGDKV